MGTKMNNPYMIDRTVVNGKYVVSTVRLQLPDEDIYGGLVFETMVFPCDADGVVSKWREHDCQRYRTFDEARTGHNDMVQNWTNRS